MVKYLDTTGLGHFMELLAQYISDHIPADISTTLAKIPDSITRSGNTFTAKNADGDTLFTFDQKDDNTTYGVVSKTANGLCPILPNETTTTKYLRQDGTWVTPPDNNTTALGSMTGTLAVSHGGTGKTTHTANAVLTGDTTNAVKNVATASGAFYATSANGAAKFGTLPIAQGGTGVSNNAGPHKILMGPASGSSNAAPTWRTIVEADLPSRYQTLGNYVQGTTQNPTDSSEHVSLAHDAWTEVSRMNLPAGVWILFGGVHFSGKAGGRRGVCIRKTSDGPTWSATATQSASPIGTVTWDVGKTVFYAISSSATNISLYAFQNTTANEALTNCAVSFYAVRIK